MPSQFLMHIILVNVKWGKEKFQDVELNSDEPPVVFKAQLFALSNVQPDRQKVMVKGVVIKVIIYTYFSDVKLDNYNHLPVIINLTLVLVLMFKKKTISRMLTQNI